MVSIIRHEDGVYFGLSETSYFSDDALGSTDIKRLLLSGAEYWYHSLRNPHRPNEDTRARRNGRAIHTCILFGRETFDKQYTCELSKDDYPDALVTVDDIKRELRAVGCTVSGSKNELTARLRQEGEYVFWDELLAEQAASGREVLKREDYWRIVDAEQNIRNMEELSACFVNGAPEVSVFWTIDGVRFRARFDYLRLNSIIDLKSYSNLRGKDPQIAVNDSLFNYKYDLQASHYLTGREHMRRLIRAGRVFGDMDRNWLQKLADVDDYLFTFVFYQMNGAAISEAVNIVPGSIPEGAASVDVGRAIDRYKQYQARFGDGQWFHMAKIRTLTDDQIPAWHRTAPID
jgi:hypothetical protein